VAAAHAESYAEVRSHGSTTRTPTGIDNHYRQNEHGTGFHDRVNMRRYRAHPSHVPHRTHERRLRPRCDRDRRAGPVCGRDGLRHAHARTNGVTVRPAATIRGLTRSAAPRPTGGPQQHAATSSRPGVAADAAARAGVTSQPGRYVRPSVWIRGRGPARRAARGTHAHALMILYARARE
jgi:hypothetical protein